MPRSPTAPTAANVVGPPRLGRPEIERFRISESRFGQPANHATLEAAGEGVFGSLADRAPRARQSVA